MKKQMRRYFSICLVAALVGVSPGKVLAATVDANVKGETNQYLVMTRDKDTLEEVKENKNVSETGELTDTSDLQDENIAIVEMPEATAKQLEKDADVLCVEENDLLEGLTEEAADEVPIREEQWNLSAIHWDKTYGTGSGIKVGILDSGVNYDEDIDVAQDIRMLDADADVDSWYYDVSGHGTGVAGLVAAKDNELGISGLAPESEVVSIKVLDDNKQGYLGTVIAGIYRAIEEKCDILNMSFGTVNDSELLHKAVRDASDAGILMIASAGNNAGSLVYPAAYPEVMAVGSTNADGVWMEDTAGGEELEILAPGDQILVSSMFSGAAVEAGTSVAAAQVTGAAAQIWSKIPEQSADYIRQLLKSTTQNVENSPAGLLDIENCLKQEKEFEKIYQPGNHEDSNFVDLAKKSAESYDAEGLVNGMFKGADHSDCAEVATKGYTVSSDNMKLIRAAAKLPDDKLYNNARMFHGANNYMETLKFLYTCANYLKAGNSIAKSVDLAGKDTGIKEKCEDGNAYDLLMKQADTMIRQDMVKGVSEKNSEAKMYKAIGLAVHLIGDTFAHRSIVPEKALKKIKKEYFKTGTHASVSEETLRSWAMYSSTYADKICKHWECFKKSVEMQIIEFRDIHNYSTYKYDRGIYEDGKDFCSDRFLSAKNASIRFFRGIMKGSEYNGISILHSTGDIKLNGMKGYSKSAGEPKYSSYTEEQWEKWSNAKRV